MKNAIEGIFFGLFIVIIITILALIIVVDNNMDARRAECKAEAAPYQYKLIERECFALTPAGTWVPTETLGD